MITMDVFKSNAFSATSMTNAVDKVGYVPGLLGSIPGLVVPAPVRTTDIFIEDRGTDAALIQTDQRGAPPKARGGEQRKVRAFRTVRLAQSDTIHSHELQNIRAFGSETELQALQVELARRMFLMRRDLELTRENLYLSMVQGVTKDADGSTIYDWATEFNQVIPAEVDWDLDNASPASGVVRTACNVAVRSILRGLKGLGGNNVQIVGLCGDTFFDNLTAHPEVRQTYLNWQAASDLREGNAFQQFSFGGITFINYRGTDDGTTVGVNTNLCKFFPVGAGIFQEALSPGETFEFVNTLGQPVYSMVVPDKDRNMWVKPEIYSYPLPVCTMPQALYRARRT
jgi:hypothetical protein